MTNKRPCYHNCIVLTKERRIVKMYKPFLDLSGTDTWALARKSRK